MATNTSQIGYWYNPITKQLRKGAKPGPQWVLADPKTGKPYIDVQGGKVTVTPVSITPTSSQKTQQQTQPTPTQQQSQQTQQSTYTGSLQGTLSSQASTSELSEITGRIKELEAQYRPEEMGAFERTLRLLSEYAYDDRRKKELTQETVGFDISNVSPQTFRDVINYFDTRRGGEISTMYAATLGSFQDQQKAIKQQIDDLVARRDDLLKQAMQYGVPVTYEEVGLGGKYSGSRSWRNNNPGNIKYTETTRAFGAIGQDKDGFAIFPDVQTGRNAMLSLLQTTIYSNLTLDAAMRKWSGKGYGAEIVSDVINPNTIVRDLFPKQDDNPSVIASKMNTLNVLLDRMTKREGWFEGEVRTGLIQDKTTQQFQDLQKAVETLNSVSPNEVANTYDKLKRQFLEKYGIDASSEFNAYVGTKSDVTKGKGTSDLDWVLKGEGTKETEETGTEEELKSYSRSEIKTEIAYLFSQGLDARTIKSFIDDQPVSQSTKDIWRREVDDYLYYEQPGIQWQLWRGL